jgi:hypothetical protein
MDKIWEHPNFSKNHEIDAKILYKSLDVVLFTVRFLILSFLSECSTIAKLGMLLNKSEILKLPSAKYMQALTRIHS